MIWQIIKLMRVHHSIKNFLLFLPIVFSGNLLQTEYVWSAFFGYLAFGCISSMVYVINDILDIEKDRVHPTKCKRPIASGAVPMFVAVALAIFLLVIGFGIHIRVFGLRTGGILLGMYLVLNIGYSLGLKNIPMVDIVILVSGFLIRVFYGAEITETSVSDWLCLTVMAVSFYMGMGKRRNELLRQGAKTRFVLQYYTYEFLDKNMYLSNTLIIVFYALWCITEETAQKYGGKMILTIPLVLLISMKYSLNIETTSDGDPVDVILHDQWLVGLAFLYVASVFFIIYSL